MKEGPYALCTDGSNDEGLFKLNPLLVRVFDINEGKVVSQLLDMCTSKKNDAENLFNLIDDAIKENDIDWNHCVAIGMDNTSVNMGVHNSIKSRVLNKNSSVHVNGCPCHIVHNTAGKGAEDYATVTSFDIEDFLVDLYHYFDKSSKRKVTLEEFCLFCEQEYKKIIKYVSTRWLSLEAAVTRSLKIHPSLKSYFLSAEDETGPRFHRLVQHYSGTMLEVHLFFFQSVLQIFIRFNLYLQRHDPQLPTLHDQIYRFMRELACKFVNIEAIHKAEDVIKLNVDDPGILKDGRDIYFYRRILNILLQNMSNMGLKISEALKTKMAV